MSKKLKVSDEHKQPDELTEDMELVGPGQMLSEARNKLSLSTEDVAARLNFKKCLVEDIEHDIFDQKLPATFNRGYLRNYSKLVNVDVDEVLSAYDMLGVAEVQRSEMQSFSNLTEKQAEHSRLMWLSYFIAALLVGLMILWWQQEPKQNAEGKTIIEQVTTAIQSSEVKEKPSQQVEEQVSDLGHDQNINIAAELSIPAETKSPSNTQEIQAIESPEDIEQAEGALSDNTLALVTAENEVLETVVVNISTAVFTFSGDCWVNIYDATGERIAWGVKKSGYVMTVQGVPPLKITLGKPELASIIYNEQPIDMSGFNAGNIAKFTLPLTL